MLLLPSGNSIQVLHDAHICCSALQTDEPQQPASLLQGPAVSACLDRHEHKGEDKGLKVIGATWTPEGSNGKPPG
jgi:hypothetical protein